MAAIIACLNDTFRKRIERDLQAAFQKDIGETYVNVVESEKNILNVDDSYWFYIVSDYFSKFENPIDRLVFVRSKLYEYLSYSNVEIIDYIRVFTQGEWSTRFNDTYNTRTVKGLI